jgi:CBS domain-containing protein
MKDDLPVFAGGEASIQVYMAEQVAWLTADATLKEAAIKLTSVDVGALVVGDGKTVEGIVSERDIVHAVADGTPLDRPLSSILVGRKLLRISSDATVAEAARVMEEEYVRHLLVDDKRGLVGIVSARDLLGAYVSDTGL